MDFAHLLNSRKIHVLIFSAYEHHQIHRILCTVHILEVSIFRLYFVHEKSSINKNELSKSLNKSNILFLKI